MKINNLSYFLIIVLVSIATSLSSQSAFKKAMQNHRHGIVVSGDLAVLGSDLPFRPGLGIGYTYFSDKFNFKSMVEYGIWSKQREGYSSGAFRFGLKFDYERYLNNWFSLSAYISYAIRYYEDFYGDSSDKNTEDVDYVLGLGLTPRIYKNFSRSYLSLGVDLPLIEMGYFQDNGPDPGTQSWELTKPQFKAKGFHKELRAVISAGYRF